MPTDLSIDPSQATLEIDSSPSDTYQPSEEEPTETVEELRERLAAAENEAKRWKGRVEKANEDKPKKTKVDPEDLAELEWKLDNKNRIALVEQEYESILNDGYQGEQIISKKVALGLAEGRSKVDNSDMKRSRQDDMSQPAQTTRTSDPKGYETELDREIGLTFEKRKKLEARHPHLKGL